MTEPVTFTLPLQTRLLWRRGQQLALLVLCLLAGAALALRTTQRPQFIGLALPVDGAKISLAAEKINPNTASIASLDRLPGIGRTRAATIVAYRNQAGPNAFRTAEDMTKIKGIGKATVEHMAPYLALP